ncbi:MAG: hypothetical protein EA385_15020 [Salinarimonadaceae bacterium]|nr:MAG: hypothetical protein EA385_15020 [Salinarimonadaceae bacterium]
MSNTHARLLPSNSTPLELLLDEVNDPIAILGAEYDGITIARQNPPPQILPFLIWQLGLGELTPYLPELYALIDDGIRWQRIRGTPASIRKGLGWIGYDYTVLEEETDRVREGRKRLLWSLVQIELDRLRDADLPDLERIAGITQLSLPARSHFVRAYRGYDVRALETDWSRADEAMADEHSGARIAPMHQQWSFGRLHEIGEVTLGFDDLDPLDAWLTPVDEEGDTWEDADFPWEDAAFPWALPLVEGRRREIISRLLPLEPVITFRDNVGAVIGHARAVATPVRLAASGAYTIGGTVYAADANAPEALVVYCRTPFGAGAGATAATAEILFASERATGVPPGRLWMAPADRTGGHSVAQSPVSIPFGLTVREHVRFLVRFANEL